MRRIGFLAAMVVFVFATSSLVSAAVKAGDNPQRVFKAGAATSNITPFLGAGIVGNWTVPEATQVHDELHARCLVLDDGKTKLAFVICDNVSIGREVFDWARERIEKDTGIPAANMLMSSTHTHSGPSARAENVLAAGELNEYQMLIARRIVDGVKRAIGNMEPAQIGWGAADEPTQVFNRRWFMKKDSPSLVNPFGKTDQVKMNPPTASEDLIKPAGPTDPQVSFISVRAKDGRPIALLANYSLHYVGGIPSGVISADYFAAFADRIQHLIGADRLDPPFVGIMSNGTSGNINNIDFSRKRDRKEPYEQMRFVADLVAQKVYEQYKQLEHHDWVELDAKATEMELAVRKPDAEEVQWAREELKKPEEPKRRMARIYANRTLQLHESPSTISIMLQVVRIGDLAIAAIPFETFVETGLEIKKRTPFPRAFTISLANGGYGYLPTSDHHILGGYETWLGTNKVQKDAAEKITERLLAMMGDLKQ